MQRDAFATRAAGQVESILDLLFPRHCAGCGGKVDRPSGHICWDCFQSIELRQGAVCEQCGLHVEGEMAHRFTCGVCQLNPPDFDRARSAGRFSGVLRELLLAFKYRGATWLSMDLAGLLHGCVMAHLAADQVDLVMPVPLHASKLRDRGYNQAALLAEALGRSLDRPHFADLLVRVRPTPTQTRLHAEDRRRNVKGAFSAAGAEAWIRARTILLVDDVMTTGATLSEAAAVLREAGAWRVWAVTVAHG